ncbi:hypothetical protein GO491_10000 [Flavobacteriaceae bacterium Ap0902]|nr:hypothetical protein [Flavobacteriaceae bacterium Ap0902]
METNKNHTYIIAEIGPNHNGEIQRALDMIEQLARVGVDAVKFQITVPENAYSLDAFKADYQKKESNSGESAVNMSKSYKLSFEDHFTLYQHCLENKVDYLCSAFEMESLKFINENFNLPFYKIPSGEIFSVDLIEYMAKYDKPFILSTGMASYDEIEKSIELINSNFKKDITILHCISNYPAPYEDVNLNVMLELKKRFDYPIGFSDHTIGNDASIAAVALGASIIEKHVTQDKSLPGPDHKASITIEEFGELVKSIRNVEKMLGSTEKKLSEEELKIKKAVRKSFVATKDLPSGHVLEKEDITFKRPGIGISPLERNNYIGKILKKSVKENRVIKKEDFE